MPVREHFSAAFSADVDALPNVPVVQPVGQGASRKRYKRTTIEADAGFLDAELINVLPFRSSDRILDIRVSTDAAIVGGATSQLGLYEAGKNHDGDLIDANFFDAVLDLGATNSELDARTETQVVGVNKGLALWEQMNIVTPATYADDPKEDWEMVITIGGNITTGGTIVVEVEYVSGD